MREPLGVPRSWEDITPSWMTVAISARHPGAVVSGVRLAGVEEGTNRRARALLTYSAGYGPESVFVKAPGRTLHRMALLALGAVEAEARLAWSGVELPIESPVPFAAAVDRSRLAAVVVMDDINCQGGVPNAATVALPVAEVYSGLEGLARLHGAYWDRPLPSTLGFVKQWRLGRAWAPVSWLNLERGIRRLDRSGGAALVPPSLGSRRLERQFRHSAALASSGPLTLLHGDAHPGNTYRLPGGKTGFYDWQLVRWGNWSHDVGYFIAGSLEVDDRRAHERQLLCAYLDALREEGVEVPSSADAWERYRATPAFGLGTWLHTLGVGSLQPAEVCLATIARFGAAYSDLRTERSPAAGRGPLGWRGPARARRKRIPVNDAGPS
jgi:hypothetical protein